MRTVEEMNMLAAKLDLLIKCLDKHGTIQSLYSHIPCEVCRNFRHSGNDCLGEDALNDNNGFHPQRGPGWNQFFPQNQEGNYTYSNLANQPFLKDLVLGQAQINENLIKNLASNNKFFENINPKLEGLTVTFKN